MKMGKWWAGSAFTFIKKCVVASDLYPTTITFTYEGNDSFKTFFGDFISILINFGALWIALMLTTSIINKENTSLDFNKVINDITNDSTRHYFAQNKDVYFAIKLSGPTPEKLLDKTYFSFYMYQASYIKNNGSQGISATVVCKKMSPYAKNMNSSQK